MMINSFSELLQLLHENKFYIYGNGSVGKRFYQYLCQMKMERNVISFVISDDKSKNDNEVKTLSEITGKETLVCIATHEVLLEDISNNLKKMGFINYVWIYPWIYMFAFGNPINENVEVECEKIWRAYKSNYALAARYLAISQYYGKCDDGYEIYLKTLDLVNDKETSKKRLFNFIELIKNWDINGYQSDKSVYLLDNYHVIDGLHRFSLACYHRQKSIKCSVFKNEGFVEKIDKVFYIPKEKALELGLDKNTIQRLDDANKMLQNIFIN